MDHEPRGVMRLMADAMKRNGRSKLKLAGGAEEVWTSVDFGSCLNRARAIEEQIISACNQHRFPEKDVFAIKLALEEALVNACKHGNSMDPCKHVKVQFRVTDQRADITIEDEGKGFCCSELPDPTAEENLEKTHGRGILLMRAYMSSVVFNPSGNKVTLTKFNDDYTPTQSKSALG